MKTFQIKLGSTDGERSDYWWAYKPRTQSMNSFIDEQLKDASNKTDGDKKWFVTDIKRID